MYVVASYDFGRRCDIKLHLVTERVDLAHQVYASVLAVCDRQNKDAHASARMLVELTRVEQDTPLLGAHAPTLFWGNAAIATNNHAVDGACAARLNE